MEDDQQRFISETGEEAHYWFTLSDFVELTLNKSVDDVLSDMLQLRAKHLKVRSNNG